MAFEFSTPDPLGLKHTVLERATQGYLSYPREAWFLQDQKWHIASPTDATEVVIDALCPHEQSDLVGVLGLTSELDDPGIPEEAKVRALASCMAVEIVQSSPDVRTKLFADIQWLNRVNGFPARNVN